MCQVVFDPDDSSNPVTSAVHDVSLPVGAYGPEPESFYVDKVNLPAYRLRQLGVSFREVPALDDRCLRNISDLCFVDRGSS